MDQKKPIQAKSVAGYGQPFYATLTWPFSNMLISLFRSADEIPGKPSSLAYMPINDHFGSLFSSFRNTFLAYLAVFYLHPGGQDYPALSGDAKVFEWSWAKWILWRNILGTVGLCGLWEWFLYFSPWRAKLFKYKFTKSYPSMAQMGRDFLVTIQATILAGFMEIGLCILWANDQISWQKDMMSSPLTNIFGATLLVHTRASHFWFVHRIMHPWRISWLPDIGKFLYRHAHYLHHKSHNPTAFSGTAMHPIEAAMYYSAALIPVAVGAHPVHAVAYFFDCAIQAWIGHSGFQFPGSGNYFHTLHHRHFDCNYGTPHVPLDGFFGTHAAEKEDVRKIWQKED